MYSISKIVLTVILAISFVSEAAAQTGRLLAPPTPPKGTGPNYMYPLNPTSADMLSLSLSRYKICGFGIGTVIGPGNLYRVSMVQNVITVSLSVNTSEFIYPSAGCTPATPDVVEIGRLPAGNFVLNVIEPQSTGSPTLPTKLVDNYSFTVSDARATKASPWVRQDYSGHWWDPNDSGWGLFIWQDAKSPTDSILAAWFTYAPDGKSQWYVFQPTWQSALATTSSPLWLTARPPGATSPPPGNTGLLTVGTASLDFDDPGATGAVGKITYQFGTGPTLVRTIRRFAP